MQKTLNAQRSNLNAERTASELEVGRLLAIYRSWMFDVARFLVHQ